MAWIDGSYGRQLDQPGKAAWYMACSQLDDDDDDGNATDVAATLLRHLHILSSRCLYWSFHLRPALYRRCSSLLLLRLEWWNDCSMYASTLV